MAKTTIPDPIKRRHLIEQDMGEAQCLALADAYEAEGRTFESLQFLEKAGAKDRLAGLMDRAVASGDAFLLRQLSDLLGQDPGAERWSSLASNAAGEGLDRYSEMAQRHARSSEE